MTKRRVFSPHTKRMIVQESLDQTLTLKEVAERHDITRSQLYQWRSEHGVPRRPRGRPAPLGRRPPPVVEVVPAPEPIPLPPTLSPDSFIARMLETNPDRTVEVVTKKGTIIRFLPAEPVSPLAA